MNQIIGKQHEQEIELILFDIMGHHFGVDTTCILSMRAIENKDDNSDVVYFHEIIGLSDITVVYHSPKILVLGNGDVTFEIVIDEPYLMPLKVPLSDLCLLPKLIDSFLRTKFDSLFWALLPSENSISFIMDSRRLLEIAARDYLDLRINHEIEK
ncbi:hypothetical protein [Desulfamplus magnetovallimortis]|nr:hypothetical protein [Desulfamplus magnetovallimortis]